MSIFTQTRTSKITGLVFLVFATSLIVGTTAFGAVNSGSNPFSNGAQPAMVGGLRNYASQEPGRSGAYENEIATTGVVSTGTVAVTKTITCENGNVPASQVKDLIAQGAIVVTVVNGNATVVNKTSCNLPVSLASYGMYGTDLASQRLSDYTSVSTVAAGSSQTMVVRLPSCMAQIDLYYGEAPHQLDNANTAGPRTLGWSFYQNSGNGRENPVGPLCQNAPVAPRVTTQVTTTTTTTTVAPVCTSATVLTADQFMDLVYAGKITSTITIDAAAKKTTGVITNTTDCKIAPISISVYKMYDQKLSTQQYFSGTSGTLNANSNLSLMSELPPCMAQIDLWYGEAPRTLLDSNPYWTPGYSPRNFAFKFYQNSGSGFADAAGPFCSNTQPQLVCTPNTQTVNVNQLANLSAAGGTGAYAWVATSGTPASGSGNNFSTKYSTSGNKSVTVTSGSQTATCNVVVNTPPPQLVCTPSTQTVNVSQVANFSATGGSGAYAWTATSGAPASGSGTNFATSYATVGSKSVTVTSGNQSATCTTIVTTVNVPQLVCAPAVQTVNINQAAVVSATGGNGTYSWTAPGASSANLNGQNVSIVYASAGTRTATVNSGNQSAVCTIVVNQPNQNTTLSITKLVRNVSQQGTFAENSSNVRPGDVLEYQIRIRNTGSVNANAVQLADFINQANLLTDFRGFTASRGFTGQLHNGTINFAESLAPNAEILVAYTYTVVTGMNNATTVCNTATTSSSNSGTTSDVACVTGSTGTVNLVLSKSAWNDTKNVDATTQAASREDYITYKLTVRNTGTADALNYIFSDNLSGVLPLADVTDLGGGTITGQTISYPVVTIPANGTVTKTFRVRVKFFLSPSISYQMINTFGNTITVVINPPTPYVPPRTGGYVDLLAGVGFAGLLTSAFVLQRKKNIFRLIFT